MALEHGERFQAWFRLDHNLCPIGQEDGHCHALIRDLLEEPLQRLSFQCLKRHGLCRHRVHLTRGSLSSLLRYLYVCKAFSALWPVYVADRCRSCCFASSRIE